MPMSQSKSQWDFGELFPTEAARKVLSVSDLTAQVRRLLEKQIGQIWVTGELTNFRAQSSGHLYFTLKDAHAQLTCVLFRGETVANRELLQDGRKVILQGELTVYEPRGQYQLRVTKVELQGVGALQIAFEKLKQKLNAEGLFAPERKRPVPKFTQRIGLVTSPTGAAIRDVLHVIKRRHPGLEIILAPCKVQGEGAAYEISAAIRLLNEFKIQNPKFKIDLILLTRGGGSLEDLWAFNEESLARAIFESALPIISAVGHEIDFTISDFVADVRAATPSAAVEIITEGVFASGRFVSEISDWLKQRAQQRLEREQKNFQQLTVRLARVHPRRRLNEKLQWLDELQISLFRCVKHDWRKQLAMWQNLQERLSRIHPRRHLKQRHELLRQEKRRLLEQARHRFQKKKTDWATHEARLRLLSPEPILARGYSITTDAETDGVIRRADQVCAGQKLKTRLHVGEILSQVEK